jgi:hypothetical protein
MQMQVWNKNPKTRGKKYGANAVIAQYWKSTNLRNLLQKKFIDDTIRKI